MADWKIPVNYNYSPPYHTYAYGLVYQAGPEQTHSNLSGWAEAPYHTGVNGGYYSPPPQAPQQESPPQSPEHNVIAPDNGQHYPSSAILYFGDPHGRLFMSHNRTQHDGQTKEVERTNSNQTSDSEANTSPDSWSSGSSREGCIPPTHHVPWVTKDHNEETPSRSPDGNARVSSSQGPTMHVLGAEEESTPDTKHTSTPKVKPKARSAFSQSQMIALTHRFNIQRYLTPVEMKTLAGLTGLTYKQVKTWFQNRRMKLRRHQKDNSWVSERGPATVYSNSASTLNQFQANPQTQDYYSQQMRKTQLNVSQNQKLPYYANPSATLTHPGVTLTHHGATLTHPSATLTHPSVTLTHPSATLTHPIATLTHPIATLTHPSATLTHPAQPTSPQLSPRPQDSWPLPPPVTHYELLTSGYSTARSVDNTSINSD